MRRAAAAAIAGLFAIGCRARGDDLRRDEDRRPIATRADAHVDETLRAPEVLAEGLDFPSLVRVDARFAYVLTLDRIVRVPLGGGTPEDLAPALGDEEGLAVDDRAVYTISPEDGPTHVWAVPTGDGAGAPRALAKIDAGYRLAVDATHVYVASGPERPSRIYSIPKSGGPATVLVDDLHYASDVSVDGDDVVFVEWDEHRVGRVRKTGGAPRWIVAATTTIHAVAAEGGAVVWADTQLHALLGAGTEPSFVAQDDAYDLTLRDGSVYWGTWHEDGWVWRAPLDGGPARKIAASPGRVDGVTTDARYVYWVEFGAKRAGGYVRSTGRLLRAPS